MNDDKTLRFHSDKSTVGDISMPGWTSGSGYFTAVVRAVPMQNQGQTKEILPTNRNCKRVFSPVTPRENLATVAAPVCGTHFSVDPNTAGVTIEEQGHLHNLDCTWSFSVSNSNQNYRLEATIVRTSLERRADGCSFDYLHFSNGPLVQNILDSNTELLTGGVNPLHSDLTMCGTCSDQEFRSSGPAMTIRFLSDVSIAGDIHHPEYTGSGFFKIVVQAVPRNDLSIDRPTGEPFCNTIHT